MNTRRPQPQDGAILVEAAIAFAFLLTLLLAGLYLSRYVNNHAILIAAARNASRSLSQFDPTGDGRLPPGHVFSSDEYAALVQHGYAVARRYVQTAGLDPNHYGYRVSNRLISAGAGSAGQGSINGAYEEIEVAIYNLARGPFEPFLCVSARFKYELFHNVNHYLTTEPDPC